MEKANLNPKYTGVHIWLRKDGNLKKAFEDKVGEDIYKFFMDLDAYNVFAAYGEHNFMWLHWRGLEGYSEGSFGGISQANIQLAKDIANLLPSNRTRTYGGTFMTYNQHNTSWLYSKRWWTGSQIGYAFGWTWWNSHHHPHGAEVGYTKFSPYEHALRYFDGVLTDTNNTGSRFGLGPGPYALWLTNGKPSTNLFELFLPYLNTETKNHIVTKIHPKWRGYFLKPRYKIIKFRLEDNYTWRQAIGNVNSTEILNFKYDLRVYPSAAAFTELEKLAVGGVTIAGIEFKHSYDYKEANWTDPKPWHTTPVMNLGARRIKVVETIDVPFCSPSQSEYMIEPVIEDSEVNRQRYKAFNMLSSQIFTYAAVIWEPIK